MLSDKIMVQGIPGAIEPWETVEGVVRPLFRPQEYQIIDLRMVLRLTDQHPVPVYLRLRPMCLTTVFRHQPRGEFNSALRSKNPSPESLEVVISHPHSPKSLGLL